MKEAAPIRRSKRTADAISAQNDKWKTTFSLKGSRAPGAEGRPGSGSEGGASKELIGDEAFCIDSEQSPLRDCAKWDVGGNPYEERSANPRKRGGSLVGFGQGVACLGDPISLELCNPPYFDIG